MPSVEDITDFDLTGPAPDESEVRVHQVLSMPPDYQLRAPADGSVPIDQEGQANPYALPTLGNDGAVNAQVPADGAVAPTDPNAAAPAQVAAADPNAAAPSQVAAADPNAPGPQTLSTGAQTASPPATTVGGVNPLNPDGTKKSSNEINEELRQRRLEEERRRNPNYGTIFNIGSLFED
jgi:hypothetical protein